jgi:hypothetical protein
MYPLYIKTDTLKSPKIPKNTCDSCHYTTDNIKDFNKHTMTANPIKTHKMDTLKSPKIPKNTCDSCHYTTDNIKDYKKHMMTAKHIKNHKNNKMDTLKSEYICNCGKKYKFSQGLSKHRNVCCIINPVASIQPQNECENILMHLESDQPANNFIVDESDEPPWTIDPSSNEIKLNR